ncbi:MAG TPA: hypothetical protein VEC99_16235 [Clostridia bacterium]|nr:hypothetical protein [Clostridia bacterium]
MKPLEPSKNAAKASRGQEREERGVESQQEIEKLADTISQSLLPFLSELAGEAERSAVVLAAERINVLLI